MLKYVGPLESPAQGNCGPLFGGSAAKSQISHRGCPLREESGLLRFLVLGAVPHGRTASDVMEPPSKAATTRLRPERNDRRFPPLGVTQMPPYSRIGEYSTETGLLTWMVHTIDNHNASQRGRSPRRCGWRLSRNAPSEAGQHRLPASDATKRSEAAPRAFRFARRATAPGEAGDSGAGAAPR